MNYKVFSLLFHLKSSWAIFACWCMMKSQIFTTIHFLTRELSSELYIFNFSSGFPSLPDCAILFVQHARREAFDWLYHLSCLKMDLWCKKPRYMVLLFFFHGNQTVLQCCTENLCNVLADQAHTIGKLELLICSG